MKIKIKVTLHTIDYRCLLNNKRCSLLRRMFIPISQIMIEEGTPESLINYENVSQVNRLESSQMDLFVSYMQVKDLRRIKERRVTW
jgi:hypothetical protein